VLIAESFILLALDPAVGRVRVPQPDTDADALCAAGLLVELAAQRRLAPAASGRLYVDARIPASHSLLTEAAQALALLNTPVALEAVSQVRQRLAPLTQRLLDGLYRRDFLHRIHDWRLWRADRLRYPLRSLQARNEAVTQLQQASHDADDVAGLGLLLLAHAAGILTQHLDGQQHERAQHLLLALNDTPADGSPRAALALIRSALLA
jgi:Golgi phosphoprotein 3 (GPP34)